MSKYLGPLLVVLLAVACGGTTDSPASSNGGTSAGGTSAGNGSGGSASGSAGKATGGDVATGGSVSQGGFETGGSVTIAGSAGVSNGGVSTGGISNGGASGGGTLDPRCPAHRPMGMCMSADTGLNCQYDYFTNCLCYTTPVGTFSPCQKVDPTCTLSSGGGGAGGASGAAGTAGSGGVSAKIALPPRLACSCSAMTWTCN